MWDDPAVLRNTDGGVGDSGTHMCVPGRDSGTKFGCGDRAVETLYTQEGCEGPA